MVKITKNQLRALVKESTQRALMESPQVRKVVLESRLRLIESEIELDEAGWMERAKNWLTGKANKVMVNPSQDVDNPDKVARMLNQAVFSAKKAIVSFKADGLKTSTKINALQDAVTDLFGKFFNLLDTIPSGERGKMEREVMKVVGLYYDALMEEKMRIEVYISDLAREIGSQGYDLGRSSTAMSHYKAPSQAKVSGSRVTEPETDSKTPEPDYAALAGARA
jgi:hypothetical protein